MNTQNAETIRSLSESHQGKVSDKWSSYLTEYQRLFRDLKDRPLSLLEIGIQNGGSLEIWAKYFGSAERLIGCDINEKCRKLTFEDQRIAVIVGDANTDPIQRQIEEKCASFDIIIDDGSHKSGDIVKSFARYFPLLKPGGLFLAEDLHCSYWKEFEGGLFDPLSSISFFKDLSDIINHEHWGIAEPRTALLDSYAKRYNTGFNETDLAQILSVEFLNSICVVKKSADGPCSLGVRRFAGTSAEVFAAASHHSTREITAADEVPDESRNEWSGPDSFKNKSSTAAAAAEIAGLRDGIARRDLELRKAQEEIAGANRRSERLAHDLASRESSLSWKITSPLRFLANAFVRK
ncbi:MAG: class I SAM-dependent methyltransferase [Terrimicrobiaceae bacterium]